MTPSVPPSVRWDWLWIPTAWLLSLGLSLVCPNVVLGIPMVILRIWTHTGLFILAHDAMHGSLFPHHPRWNRRAGSLALACYGWLPFDRCCRLHHQHHAETGQAGDPDGQQGHSFWGWYWRFMGHYISLPMALGLLLTWMVGSGILFWAGWSGMDIATYWLGFTILPLVGSSLQLFVFGTYLPHRGAGIRSYPWPVWLSCLACYHFGYHQEHHNHPHQPWYRLPSLYTGFTESEEYVKLHEPILINTLWLQPTWKNGRP